MEREQSRHLALPITTAVAANGGSGAAHHLGTNVLSPFLGALATLVANFLTNNPVHDATLASLLQVFALSILCFFGALLATSLLRPTATALGELHDGATVLPAASAVASLVSLLLQPPFRWPAYYSCMAYTLALLVLRGGHWTKTLRGSRGLISRVLPWVRRHGNAIKEWLRAHVTMQPDTEEALGNALP